MKKRVTRPRSRREKGFAIMLTALMMMFTIPIVGLGVDAGVLYVVKGKLQAATDAGALAAARSLNMGLTAEEQEATAITRATAFFDVNFPDGMFMTFEKNVNTTFRQLNLSTLQVEVSAEVKAPLFFLRMIGAESQKVAATGTATRRNINLVMVLDRSGSMSGAACTAMKNAASTFTSYFSNGRDRMGLVSFAGNSRVDFEMNKTFLTGSPNMPDMINSISCVGATGTAQAIIMGWDRLKVYPEPLSLNVMVFYTDGQPNAIAADFPIRRKQDGTDTRYGDGQDISYVTQYPLRYPSTTWPGDNTPTNTLTTFPPSSCQDDQGDTWNYRVATGTRYNNQNSPNPYWTPGTCVTVGTELQCTMRGFFTVFGSMVPVTGYTGGLRNHEGPEEEKSTTNNACGWNRSEMAGRRDIAYIPATDIYNNDTVGYKTNFIQASGSYSGNDRFPTGHKYHNTNWLRPDSPQTVSNAAFNAADDAGNKVLYDTYLNPLIYCIGLGGQTGYPPDTEFMTRLANDGSADDTRYDSSRPQGMYVYAPDTTQLNQAFTRIASSLLRLSR